MLKSEKLKSSEKLDIVTASLLISDNFSVLSVAVARNYTLSRKTIM